MAKYQTIKLYLGTVHPYKHVIFIHHMNLYKAVADLGGARGTPPRDPSSFNFMQFLGKFGKIVCWRPPGSWRPLLGEILDPPLQSAHDIKKMQRISSLTSSEMMFTVSHDLLQEVAIRDVEF